MPEHGSINYIHMNPNKIIRSKRKTLSLTINENAELIIRAPKRLSIEKIQDFINEKENWINRKKRLIENQIKDVTSNHNKLLYLGNLFPINVEQNASKELFFTGEEFIANSIEPDSLSLSIKKWYKNKFKEIAKLINNKTFTFNKESKENGELYGSIKPKEITNLIKEIAKAEVSPSQIILKDDLNKIGTFKANINFHSEVTANISIKIDKIQSK